MPNSYFQFKQFVISQDRCAMKVTTDACLFGAWAAQQMTIENRVGTAVLDIGTGTGLLSLMLAQKNTTIHIDAIEIDSNAAEQAKENCMTSPFINQVKIIHADINYFSPHKKYDVIISNPPFYENELKPENSARNTAHHSSQLLIKELLDCIENLIADTGIFFLLLPAGRMKEVEMLFHNKNIFYHKKTMVHQTTAHGVFRVMYQCSFVPPANKLDDMICIKEKDGAYTNKFVGYLEDYYLYL